jgi:hypothetical protein
MQERTGMRLGKGESVCARARDGARRKLEVALRRGIAAAPFFCYQGNHGNVDWDDMTFVVPKNLPIGCHGESIMQRRLKRGASSNSGERSTA